MKKFPLVVLLTSVFSIVAAVQTASAAEPPPTDVVIIPHGKVENAFAKGQPMLVNSSYKIQAGRRVTAPGEVEIHEHDTDIFYVTEGIATLVTGGTAEGVTFATPGESRGRRITGGTERKIAKGDIVVIPAGVPHWFTDVSNPFLYFVVKVTK